MRGALRMPAGEPPPDAAETSGVDWPLADVLDGIDAVPDDLADALAAPLVDHHVHTSFRGPVDRATFEAAINEGSTDPVPDFLSMFDSPLGFAIRRWCAPLLGLPARANGEAYLATRSALGESEVTRRMAGRARVSDWLLDTGYSGDAVIGVSAFGGLAGGRVHEILRLETLGEHLLSQRISPPEYPEAFRALLADRDDGVVGTKSIAAYRCGFDIDWSRPAEAVVGAAVARWRDATGDGVPRMTDPVLSAFGVHAAADAGLPVQFHVGLGDRDLDLNQVDPLLLLPLLRQPAIRRVPILLLHCYPFHRNAGYLAQAFDNVYFDVGLAINYLGAFATGLIEESLELAPFAKHLYSSDAFGLAELHLLGSILWRRGMARVLGERIRCGDWSPADAARVARMIGSENARRAYRL